MRLLFTVLLISTSAQAAPKCDTVFLASAFQIEMIELSALLGQVRADPQNVGLKTDFRTKYLEVESRAGRSIKQDLLGTKTKPEEASKTRGDAEVLLRWTRAERIPIPENPHHAIYLDDRHALVAQEGAVLKFDLDRKTSVSFPVAGMTVKSTLALSKDGFTVYVGSEAIHKLNLKTGAVATSPKLPDHSTGQGRLVLSPAERFIAVYGRSADITLIDASTLLPLTSLNTFTSVQNMTFSDSETYLMLSVSAGRQVLYNTKTKQSVEADKILPGSEWKDATFIPGTESIAVIAEDGKVFSYDINSKEIKFFERQFTDPNNIRVTADGKSVFITWTERIDNNFIFRAGFFDLQTGAELPIFFPSRPGHTTLVAESDDHRELAFARPGEGSENLIVVDLKEKTLHLSVIPEILNLYLSKGHLTGSFSPDRRKILLSPDYGRSRSLMELR